MFGDLVTIALTWMLLSTFALVSAPLIYRLVGTKLRDAGWAWTRVAGWLMVAVPIWFLGHLGLPVNTSPVIWLILLGLLSLSGWLFFKQQSDMLTRLKEVKALIITEELLFAFGLVFLSLMRAWQPDINGLEKFMDAGLIQSYLISPTLPIHDMWLTGYTFNYYTFGHFLGAIATQVMRQPLAVSYNLLLAFLMGLMLMQSFGVVAFLAERFASQKRLIVAGVVGALLVVFGGNVQHLWFWLQKFTWEGYWYPDATRFIPNTIHEFPAYSFIVSDLHAHVWSMILVLLLLPILYLWIRSLLQPPKKKSNDLSQHFLLWAGVAGALVGLIASTSTWDTLIYGLFTALLGVIVLLYSRGKAFWHLVQSALVFAGATLLAASPWLLSFESISEGARQVTERSELWRFVALWLAHVVLSGVVLVIALRWLKLKHKSYVPLLFVVGMVLLAWMLLIMPEIFYMKDIYPGHPRANTMFKLTFQAFILMSLLIGWLLAAVERAFDKVVINRVLSVIIVAVALLLLTYPYYGYRDYYNLKAGGYQSLDGLTWLERLHPSDYAALEWLLAKTDERPVILEAVGESYTTFSRMSAFSGLPTVLGWPVHEWLWRGSYDIPGQRVEEVRTMYQQPLSPEARQKMREYNVTYIVVGDKEREAYPEINEAALKSLGEIVFAKDSTYIIQLGQTSNQSPAR